jgi:hypothetical protein
MSEKPKSQICFFDILPIELVELIFTNVPLTDLMRNCSLVNRRWNDIIQNPEFIPWKKAYYRYKILPNDDGSEVSDRGVPPDKKTRIVDVESASNDIDDDDESHDASGFWKHHKLFCDFDSKSFAFTNDWIKFETLIEPCLPGLTIYFNNTVYVDANVTHNIEILKKIKTYLNIVSKNFVCKLGLSVTF